jgi:hypothetical protein
MAEQWIGFTVSINCGSVLGTFRGVIARVESSDQSITLRNVDRNGEPCTSREITIKYICKQFLGIMYCFVSNSVLFVQSLGYQGLGDSAESVPAGAAAGASCFSHGQQRVSFHRSGSNEWSHAVTDEKGNSQRKAKLKW